MFYHSNRDFDYDLISVPKTIVDRLKSTPAKHDSTVDSPINTLLVPHDTQDMVNDIDDDDDVIIIDDVPEVIVIPSDDTPNDDLPCVIANIKSEPLEIELQTSKTKHTVTPQNDFECKTMVIQIPKDTKDIFECHSDGNRIKDDEVICIDEIKREPNSEVAVESTHKNLNKITTHRRTQYVHGKESSNTQTVKATPEDITKSLTNIKKSMDITYKEMEFMKKYINHSSTNPEVDIERMLPLAFVKTKCSESPEVIQKIQKPNKIKKLRQYRPKIKQTLLTDVSRNSESDVKIEVIKSVDVVEKEKLITVDLSDTQSNEQKREKGRPADMSNNLDQITPEVSEPLKVEKLVDTVVEIDIPWDAVPIKEEADPEMDLKLSDIRRIYHIDVNVGENEIDIKREINEFDLTGQSENWHQDNSPYNSQHSADDEFENDLITISPNATLNTDEDSDHERTRTRRKKGKCKVCDAHVTRPDFIKHWDTHLDLNNSKRRLKSPEVLLPQLPHGFQTLDHDDTPGIKKALNLFMNPEKLMDIERKNFRVCILCERQFNRRNDCKRHLIEHFLKNAYSNKTRCNGLKCQICGDVFEKIDMFRGHMRLHACLPVYKCEICDRTFSDSSNFSKHKKVHNFQILICDICKKKFTNKAYLAKHIKDHERTPIIKCDKCKKNIRVQLSIQETLQDKPFKVLEV
ncbi:unnamed protein product [Pieris macdunnoughi]|nr:unnamed protein product [Pieris macdunnoughi]